MHGTPVITARTVVDGAEPQLVVTNYRADYTGPVTDYTAHALARQVADLTSRWWPAVGEDDAMGPRLVLAELTANVARHTPAGTRAVVNLVADGDRCFISVADTEPCRPRLGEADDRHESGRGLLLVSTCSLAWGCIPLLGGKVIWAMVPVLPQAD
jgi:signal transduction histidine kinase